MLQILVVKARLLRGVWVRALAVLLGSALGGALGLQRVRGVAPAQAVGAPALGPVVLVSTAASADEAADRECLVRRAQLWQLPELILPQADVPALRAQLLGRTKSVPVLFLSRPEPDQQELAAAGLREPPSKRLPSTPRPWSRRLPAG